VTKRRLPEGQGLPGQQNTSRATQSSTGLLAQSPAPPAKTITGLEPDPDEVQPVPAIEVKATVDSGTEPWDLSDPLNPQPNVYPVCPDCKAPWHYTWAWFIVPGRGEKWSWTRPPALPKGCRHKGQPLVYDRRTGEVTVMATKNDS
jgi:hypothetical protein